MIFDPTGWQIVNGRLVLTARKGHKTYLDAQPDGSWKVAFDIGSRTEK